MRKNDQPNAACCMERQCVYFGRGWGHVNCINCVHRVYGPEKKKDLNNFREKGERE